MTYEILNLRERRDLIHQAAAWFHAKWGVPLEAYRESMEECVQQQGAVPQWYLAVAGDEILGGLGVIENDFHTSFYERYHWTFLCNAQGDGEENLSRMYVKKSI